MTDVLEKGMNALTGAIEDVKTFVSENKEVAIGTTSAVAGVTTAGLITAAVTSRKRKRSSKHKRKSKRGKSRNRRRRRMGSRRKSRRRRTPRTAGRGRDRSRRRIRYTSKGQPYVIGAYGKARFIKKSSARRSHKQKGGRY